MGWKYNRYLHKRLYYQAVLDSNNSFAGFIKGKTIEELKTIELPNNHRLHGEPLTELRHIKD